MHRIASYRRWPPLRALSCLAALLCLSTAACAGVKVDGPGDLQPGQTGTVTVTVTNDNAPTPARSITLSVSVYYTDLGEVKHQDASTTFNVLAGPGLPWTALRYQFPEIAGVSYDWDSVKVSGDGVNPRVDSAHVAAVDSLPPGGTWTTSVKVAAK